VGHRIHGFIARIDPLLAMARSLDGAVVARTERGFGFLPLTEELADPEGPWPFEQMRRLSAALAERAAEQSRKGPVCYAETDYFGGAGTQAAIVWRDGALVFGPDMAEDRWENGRFVATPRSDRPINRGLRLLGLDRGDAVDEFEAVGLGRYRSDERWVAAATH
jgi:hypothetical protein